MPEEINPERVGVRMDVLADIIRDLNENLDMQKIFGKPVSKSLVVVADNNDLRIEEGGTVNLSDADSKKFLEILDSVIKANSV